MLKLIIPLYLAIYTHLIRVEQGKSVNGAKTLNTQITKRYGTRQPNLRDTDLTVSPYSPRSKYPSHDVVRP